MQSNKLRKQHIESFAKLDIKERLEWAFGHAQFCYSFLTEPEKKEFWANRRKGKKYINVSDLINEYKKKGKK